MIRSNGKQSSRKSNQTLHSTKPQAKKQVSTLRQRMICDMELAGYTPGTQQAYIGAVVKLQDVLRYLARYVFRIAITNHRLVSMNESHVTFRYKDRDTGQWRTLRIEGVQFLRRFLFHVLPKGFHKVRYYGLWHPCKRDRQTRARLLLELTTTPATHSAAVLIADIVTEALEQSALTSQDHAVKCPKCGSINVCLIDTIRRRNPMIVK